jgi:hypothetical protein
VLVYDTASDGKITQRNQVVFADWDPSAENDMQALAHVVDTNGQPDVGDAQFAECREGDMRRGWLHRRPTGRRQIPALSDGSATLLPRRKCRRARDRSRGYSCLRGDRLDLD